MKAACIRKANIEQVHTNRKIIGCFHRIYLTYAVRQYSENKVLPGFIIGGQYLNNIIYADATVLIADAERKLQELLNRVVIESEKKDYHL